MCLAISNGRLIKAPGKSIAPAILANTHSTAADSAASYCAHLNTSAHYSPQKLQDMPDNSVCFLKRIVRTVALNQRSVGCTSVLPDAPGVNHGDRVSCRPCTSTAAGRGPAKLDAAYQPNNFRFWAAGMRTAIAFKPQSNGSAPAGMAMGAKTSSSQCQMDCTRLDMRRENNRSGGFRTFCCIPSFEPVSQRAFGGNSADHL